MSYESEIIIRNDKIDNVDKWYWYEKDDGAWDGPRSDWIDSHSSKYFTHLKGRSMVVQAGGCLGMYPRLFSDLFDLVYTFEPDPKNFYCLNLNCQKPNIFKFNCALGMEPKHVSLNRRHDTNFGMHTITEDSKEHIPMLQLDSIPLNSLDLLCLDVECYELNIIMGGLETINKFKPVITCENGNSDIETILRPIGYECVDISMADSIYAVR